MEVGDGWVRVAEDPNADYTLRFFTDEVEPAED